MALNSIKNNKAVVLLLTLIIMAALILITFAFLYMTSIQLKSTAYELPSSKAFWLAEAGLQDYIYRLNTSFYYRSNFPNLEPQGLGDGTYEVSVLRDGYTYILTSTGKVGSIERIIRQSVDVLDVFCFVIHSFGSQTDFKDSIGTIDGNVGARIHIKDRDGITIINGKFVENSPIPSPSPVDYNGYRSIADYIVTGDYDFTAGTYGAAGGEKIWYIEGKVTIESNVIIYGSVIAEGNITVSKNATGITMDAASNYPVLISQHNISADRLTNSTINGLIYAGNNLEFDEIDGLTINGVMISENNTHIRKGTNFTISYELENPPPFFLGYDPIVIPQKDWSEG